MIFEMDMFHVLHMTKMVQKKSASKSYPQLKLFNPLTPE